MKVTEGSGIFSKSDIGAQAAWKGFSSQTLYIASRLMSDTHNHDFFPEDIEDLVIKNEGKIIEAIQIKNISSDLTLSSLASAKSSVGGEGFYKRVCSIHEVDNSFSKVRVIYFNNLGEELKGLIDGEISCKKSVLKKLTENHELTLESAEWLISSLVFEKVNIEDLQEQILKQLKDFVPVMAAPDLAYSLLIQYVSDLSNKKGSTSLKLWEEQIHQIGRDISAIDGYYKEYNNSLIRLCDIATDKSYNKLKDEFDQGISAHPSHVRNGLDLSRRTWIDKINHKIEDNKAVIIRGVSGQGKTTLCYRYLLDHYPEQLIFCIRSISSIRQAENLANALKGITKHTGNLIVYIDVHPGEQQWIILIQELQARGIAVPVLVSIREEDFRMTRIDSSSVSIEIIDLDLTKQEAMSIYQTIIDSSPHAYFRSFEEAWARFGENGPLIEFVYLLTNNQTLKQRLRAQIENLLREGHPDSWFLLLQLVSFAGRIGCPLYLEHAKKVVGINNIFSAIQRFSNEYLIKSSDDGLFLESLHPQRALIVSEIIYEIIGEDSFELLLLTLDCLDSKYYQYIMMDFFSKHSYSKEIVTLISFKGQKDWIACAGLIKTMLWLDVKRYVEANIEVIQEIKNKYGIGWLKYMPVDISGYMRPNEFIIERLNGEKSREEVETIKNSLTSLQIDYEATDSLILNLKLPLNMPMHDKEWSQLGYSLFWLAKRGKKIEIPFSVDEIIDEMLTGDVKSKADALRGLHEIINEELYISARNVLSSRIIKEYCVINLDISDSDIQCYFIPPVFNDYYKVGNSNSSETNFNFYWRNKMTALLDQIFPDRENIGVKLIGTDLLRDIGIDAYNSESKINKKNRPDLWIMELNAWEQTRIEYLDRPDTWTQYVMQVDHRRKNSKKLIYFTIDYIDFIYKKKRHDNVRWDRVIETAKEFKYAMNKEILLPKTAVDPYCLIREKMNSDFNTGNIDILNKVGIASDSLETSIHQYINFEKAFAETYRKLEWFYDQIADVIIARLQGARLDHIKNSRLALFTLFGAVKSLTRMQKEYESLFKEYSTIETVFVTEETEEMLTLLNMWSHVLNYPIKGVSIAYNAREMYKKSNDRIERAYELASERIGGKTVTVNGDIYVLSKIEDLMDSYVIEDEYVKIVLKFREAFKSAIPYNSYRWILETKSLNMIYVPIFKDVPLLSGYTIPLHRLLDADEAVISKPLFPTSLPKELFSYLDLDVVEFEKWRLASGNLGLIRMLITQYNDVIQTASASNKLCGEGIAKYIEIFSAQFSQMLTEFLNNVTPSFKLLELVVDAEVVELAGVIQNALYEIGGIYESLSELKTVVGFERIIDSIIVCMILLQSHIIRGSNVNSIIE
ncbi:hypothetical protein [Paenibacillus sp. JJ-223]|uniref:hypothetical protein n=1 Tax=Paenibacillus sp. JJ-223 TaxID=2905647 RepID=UPI001F183AA9|nr:hypothetical protein [Paenibacillus sp. JJ-223]CAH1205327.1 hypothetical protein PAECIP111890_02640 [Paenibacillus sp. JJ-223]